MVRYEGDGPLSFGRGGCDRWLAGPLSRRKVSDYICGIIGIERRRESNLIHTQCTNFVCNLKRI